MQKSRNKRLFFIIIATFVAIAFTNAIGLWGGDDLSYTAVNHGNHKHYFPKQRDEGVGMDDCPTHPPNAGETLSPQCQVIRKVVQNGKTYYLPEGADESLPVTQFPTRMPVSKERIAPNGKIEPVK